MNILFFGSGKFALKSLEALVSAGHEVSMVVTQPDKPKGRNLKLQPTEVKLKALGCGLKLFQPQDPNTEEAIQTLKEIPADIYVVVSYGHILKEAVLNLPRLYPLNIHGSLLPQYRGAAPIHWAIINGETETGISIIKMSPRMDAGDILLQKKIAIEHTDTSETLAEKLSILAAEALIEALRSIEEKTAVFAAQDETLVSFAPKLKREDGLIDWNRHSGDIARQIRGLYPWPAAYTYHKGKMIKIFKARALDYLETMPGTIIAVSKEKIAVGAKEGAVEIFELQPENGRRMAVWDFTRGHTLHAGDTLG